MINWYLFFDMIAWGIIILTIVIVVGYFSTSKRTSFERNVVISYSLISYVAIAYLIARI